MFFQPGPTTVLFREIVPETVLREVANAIVIACPPVAKRCKRLYPSSLLAQAIGIERYLETQRAIAKLRSLRDAFPFLEILEERHEGGNTHYFAIETPEVRIAVDKVSSSNSLPAHRKRLKAWPIQPSLFDKHIKIHASLLYGFGSDPATVAFMHLRFLQENGAYLVEEGIDLLAMLRESVSTVKIERVELNIATPLRSTTKRIRREVKTRPETQ